MLNRSSRHARAPATRWLQRILLAGAIIILPIGAAFGDPPLIEHVPSPAYLYTNFDVHKQLGASYNLTKGAHVDITIRDTNDQVVRTIESGVSHAAGWASFGWDATNDQGNAVDDGLYTYVIAAESADGSTGEASGTFGINSRTDIARITQPAEGEPISGTATVILSPANDIEMRDVRFDRYGGCYWWSDWVARAGDGTYPIELDTRSFDDGPRTFSFNFSYVDPLGGWHSKCLSRTAVVDNPLRLTHTPVHQYLYPNVDDYPNVGASFSWSEPAHLTATISDSAGNIVRTVLDSPRSTAGGDSIIWNGRDATGAIVPDGVYDYAIEVEGESGDIERGSGSFGVDSRTSIGTLSPEDRASVSGRVTFDLQPAGDLSVQEVRFYPGGCYWWADWVSPDADGHFRVDYDTTRLQDGAANFTFLVRFNDPFGAGHHECLSREVIIDNPLRFDHQPTNAYVYPNLESPWIWASYSVSEPVTTTIVIKDSDDAVVRRVETAASHPAGGHSFSWNGTADDGDSLPDGLYTYKIEVTGTSGEHAEGTGSFGFDRRTTIATMTPPDGETITEPTSFVLTPDDGVSVQQVRYHSNDRSCYYWWGVEVPRSEDGRYRVSFDPASQPTGPFRYSYAVWFSDPFGGSHFKCLAKEVVVRAPFDFHHDPVHTHIYPDVQWNGDAWVGYSITSTARVSITIKDESATVVRTIESDVRHSEGWHSFSWNGRADDGSLVGNGGYTYLIDVIADSGETDSGTGTIGIQRGVPASLGQPGPEDTLSRRAAFVVLPQDGFDLQRVTFTLWDGLEFGIHGPAADGRWRTTYDVSHLPNGPRQLRMDAYFKDPSGGSRLARQDLSVVIDNASPTVSIEGTPAEGPAPLDVDIELRASDPNGDDLTYSIDIGSETVRGVVSQPYEPITIPHRFVSPGEFTVTAVVSDEQGHEARRTFRFLVGPALTNRAPQAVVDVPGSVLAGTEFEIDISGADDDLDALTYRLDMGDGSPLLKGSLPTLPLRHTYNATGSYLIRLEVSDGRLAGVTREHLSVGLAEALSADAGDDLVSSTGTSVAFDASGSRPSIGIDSFEWDFGDGTTAQGIHAAHAYADAGNYEVTLTVTAGNESATDVAAITVSDPEPLKGLLVTVRSSQGDTLNGSDVVVIDSEGTRYSAVADGTGVARIEGLPDGEYSVYAWRSGFQPGEAVAGVQGGIGQTSVTLEPGEVGATEVESHRMSEEEVREAGIDPDDPENQHSYEFEIHLAFDDDETVVRGVTSSSGEGSGSFHSVVFTGSGGTGSCTVLICTYTSSGGGTTYGHVSFVGGVPTFSWLVIPGRATFLKEFFEVRMLVVNLASTAFTFEDGSASIDVPAGMVLAPTSEPQSATLPVPDIPGRSSASVRWILRGDDEGTYPIAAHYSGSLEPFGRTISLTGRTADPIKVWGGSALEMIVDAEDQVWTTYPYHLRVGLKNVADIPVHNAAVELFREGKLNYIYQPKERMKQGTAIISPGATMWTEFTLVPQITGRLRLEHSFVKKVAGDVDLDSRIISRPPEQTPETAPRLTAIALKDAVGLIWDPIEGASSYELFSTPNLDTDFGAEPLLVVPATETKGVIRGLNPADHAWFAVSAVIDGRNQMFHPLVDGQASSVPTMPGTSVSLSPHPSCGTDVRVTMRFTNIFADLLQYRVQLGRRAPLVGPLTGRDKTVAFTVPQATIPVGGLPIEVDAQDIDGWGPKWRGVIERDCNPIRVKVIGDSIAWGQGLLEPQKYPYLVGRWLKERTGRSSLLAPASESLAHSGAVLDEPEHGCSPAYPGEVPSGSPEILGCQLEQAKSSQTDLVYLDGCINDVGVWNISLRLTEDPSDAVLEHCEADLRQALIAARDLPGSPKVVLTGYYRVASLLSAAEARVMLALLNPKALLASESSIGVLSARWDEFVDAFNQLANDLVAELDPPGGADWLVFVDPEFGANDALMAPGTKLWSGRNDPMVAQRQFDCDSKVTGISFERETCRRASFGHPNIEGAKRYRDQIIAAGALSRWFPAAIVPPGPETDPCEASIVNELLCAPTPTPQDGMPLSDGSEERHPYPASVCADLPKQWCGLDGRLS